MVFSCGRFVLVGLMLNGIDEGHCFGFEGKEEIGEDCDIVGNIGRLKIVE